MSTRRPQTQKSRLNDVLDPSATPFYLLPVSVKCLLELNYWFEMLSWNIFLPFLQRKRNNTQLLRHPLTVLYIRFSPCSYRDYLTKLGRD